MIYQTYDYSKLTGKIIEVFKNRTNFAEELGISLNNLSLKLNNKRRFKQDEMIRIMELLQVPLDEIPNYFFVKSVKEI